MLAPVAVAVAVEAVHPALRPVEAAVLLLAVLLLVLPAALRVLLPVLLLEVAARLLLWAHKLLPLERLQVAVVPLRVARLLAVVAAVELVQERVASEILRRR